MRRSPHEVAVQAIVFGTLGFRASLEATAHERCATLCSQLLPWLEQQNLAGQITEYHREILKTPYQGMPQRFQTEAYWRGEAASFLGWAVQWLDRPHRTASIDTGELVKRLRILQPNLSDFVASACLRPEQDIDDYCAFCWTIRHLFQISVLDEDKHAVFNQIHQSKLAELVLSEAYHREREKAEREAAQLASATASVQGLYIARALTSEWLLGNHE